MFVVRVENDEATVYRAFRRFQSARVWASERNVEDVACLVDVFEAVGFNDAASAVAATRSGRSRALLRGEAITATMPMMPAASDIEFGRVAAARAAGLPFY